MSDRVTHTAHKRLEYLPHGSAHIEFTIIENEDGNPYILGTSLISYDTYVASVDIYLDKEEDYTIVYYCSGTYSQTTRKHINRFSKEVTPWLSYYDYKAMAESETGVIEESGNAERYYSLYRYFLHNCYNAYRYIG